MCPSSFLGRQPLCVPPLTGRNGGSSQTAVFLNGRLPATSPAGEFLCSLLPVSEGGVCSPRSVILGQAYILQEKGDRPRKEPQWLRGDSCKFPWVRSPREQVSLGLGLPGYSFTSLLGVAGFLPSAFTLRPGARLHNFSPGLFETRHMVTVRCSGHWKGKEPAYFGLNLVSNLAKPRFSHLQNGAIVDHPVKSE